MDHSTHPTFFKGRCFKDVDDRFELKNNLLEPQFVRLMRDNKKHLVVSWFANFFALALLSVKDFVQLKIFAVINFGLHNCI